MTVIAEGYYDKRADFWRKYWDKAVDFDRYLKMVKQKEAEQWLERKERIPELSEEQLERLMGFNRELNVLVYCAAWCGDCSRQIPMLLKMAEAAGKKVKVRFIFPYVVPDL